MGIEKERVIMTIDRKLKKIYKKYLKQNQPREEMLKVSCKAKMTNGSVLKGSRKFKAPR